MKRISFLPETIAVALDFYWVVEQLPSKSTAANPRSPNKTTTPHTAVGRQSLQAHPGAEGDNLFSEGRIACQDFTEQQRIHRLRT
jgi:hypothetical protein